MKKSLRRLLFRLVRQRQEMHTQVNSAWGNIFQVQVLDMLKCESWQEAAVTVHRLSFSSAD